MDLGTAVVGIISALICIAPFLIVYNNRKKKENKILGVLQEHANSHNCNIKQHEFCGDFVLGIDETRNMVFFFNHKKAQVITQFVDLAEIQICQVIKKTSNIKTESGSLSKIERVELHFIPHNKSKTETSFEIYDEQTNMHLSGELQCVDKWSKKINEHLKTKP